MKQILFLLTVLFLTNCQNKTFNGNPENKNMTVVNTSASLKPSQIRITKNELGKDWAFTVESGILECVGENGLGELLFINDSKTYAVNGVAISSKKYLPIEDIWAENPSISGTKKSLSKIIELGLKLCK